MGVEFLKVWFLTVPQCHSTTCLLKVKAEPDIQTLRVCFFGDRASEYVAQAGLELTILPQPPEWCDHRPVPPRPVRLLLFKLPGQVVTQDERMPLKKHYPSPAPNIMLFLRGKHFWGSQFVPMGCHSEP
jgi:hypothetical protein